MESGDDAGRRGARSDRSPFSPEEASSCLAPVERGSRSDGLRFSKSEASLSDAEDSPTMAFCSVASISEHSTLFLQNTSLQKFARKSLQSPGTGLQNTRGAESLTPQTALNDHNERHRYAFP
jgi:hypothetical protein